MSRRLLRRWPAIIAETPRSRKAPAAIHSHWLRSRSVMAAGPTLSVIASDAKQSSAEPGGDAGLDCRVAALLAMTGWKLPRQLLDLRLKIGELGAEAGDFLVAGGGFGARGGRRLRARRGARLARTARRGLEQFH